MEFSTDRQISRADCLALVEQSPAAVAAHDKAAWLAIFASGAIVEDPVGSTPHVSSGSKDVLGRFYDTFIAPNRIAFHVDRDMVCGLHLVRDLTIEIAMSSRVTVHVPMHLLYELSVEGDALKISRLAAHWELWPMLRQQVETGWPFLRVGTVSAVRMLRFLGVRGMLGFLSALSSVGEAGKAQLALFARYFNEGRQEQLAALFADADATIAFPHNGRQLSIVECVGQGGQMSFSKVLAAGHVVSATVVYHKPPVTYRGVAFFAMDKAGRRIVSSSFYWEEGEEGPVTRV